MIFYLFRYRAYYEDDHKHCVNSKNIENCDKEEQLQSWSDCTEVDVDYHEKYRYCVIKKDLKSDRRKSCILEEILNENSSTCTTTT